MQKVILDTNVIVSALISNSVPTRILYDLVLTKSVRPCISIEVFEEYIEVLGREKFDKYFGFRSRADAILIKLRELSDLYQTNRKIDILTDSSDNYFGFRSRADAILIKLRELSDLYQTNRKIDIYDG